MTRKKGIDFEHFRLFVIGYAEARGWHISNGNSVRNKGGNNIRLHRGDRSILIKLLASDAKLTTKQYRKILNDNRIQQKTYIYKPYNIAKIGSDLK